MRDWDAGDWIFAVAIGFLLLVLLCVTTMFALEMCGVIGKPEPAPAAQTIPIRDAIFDLYGPPERVTEMDDSEIWHYEDRWFRFRKDGGLMGMGEEE